MADKSKKSLFTDFPPVSTQEWMKKVTADLKGADFEKKLVWKTNEGFKVRPFYREEDLEQVKYLDSLPGEFPFIRGTQISNKWLIRQDIEVDAPDSANKSAQTILEKGCNSIGFIIKDEKLITAENIKRLLKGIDSDKTELNFIPFCKEKELYELVVNEVKAKDENHEKIIGSVNFDPLGKLTIEGRVKEGIDSVAESVTEMVNQTKKTPCFRSITVNGKNFGNAGSTVTQELAFSLAAGNEYLAMLTSNNVTPDEAAGSIRFDFGTGSNYFMEIARLRAARLLWAAIVDEYKPASKESCKMIINCETSEFNKTVYDPYVNMLRTQTEAMSATIGGCHSLNVQPFDKSFRKSSLFSERIARNQQLLLKEESYFGMITDPSAGSYYIENLTDKIVNEAWKEFLKIEEQGGYLKALKDGFIQDQINTSAQKYSDLLASRRTILIGTNQYPNPEEEMSSSIDKTIYEENLPEQGEVKPVKKFRLSKEFEKIRIETEKAAKRPRVFMLTYGHLAMRLARSQFSGNFFGSGGYEIIDNLGFETVKEGVDAAIKAEADIVVLCSSDEEYAKAAPEAFDLIGNKAQLVVAGAPACMDDLKAKGIKHFINIKSNLLETLKGFNQLLLK
ncbi:methylmalonyl-CoA mutase family protein [Marinilabiliaceae bacterium ANBcel2]|nr:methylmalonyl-CoA mutase family protein [Marinilabiliaceae bacterium ANBcel2]